MGLKDALTPEAQERILKLAPRDKQKETEPEGAILPFPKEAWTGFFEDYRKLVAPCTEAPDEYHWATLLIVISLILGRRVYFKNPNPLYPNFYVLLIGPTGRNKKSTCLGFGELLAEQVGDEIRVIRHPQSLEGVYKVLAEKPGMKALIYQDEFKGLLAASHRPAVGNFLPGLNTLYACPLRDSLTRKEKVDIEKPFVSLLTGAPQRWIEDAFQEGDFTGGFMSRVMTIGGKRKDPLPRAPSPDPQGLSTLAQRLKKLTDNLPEGGVELKWSKEAIKLWDPWYRAQHEEMDRSGDHEGSLAVRIPDTVLKIAMIYSFTEGKKFLTEKAMGIAIKVGEYLSHNTVNLFGAVAFSRKARIEQRILKGLREKGLMTRKAIYESLGGYYSTEEKNAAMDALLRGELIEECGVENPRGPKGKGYRLKGGV